MYISTYKNQKNNSKKKGKILNINERYSRIVKCEIFLKRKIPKHLLIPPRYPPFRIPVSSNFIESFCLSFVSGTRSFFEGLLERTPLRSSLIYLPSLLRRD